LKIEGENISTTYHEKIKIFTGTRLTRGQLEDWLSPLTMLVETRNTEAVLNQLRMLVPEYQSQLSSQTGAERPQALSASC